MYAVARAYYIAHGDLNVPSNHVTPEGKRLGAWLNRQRQIRSGKLKGSLSPEQIRALDEIGMSWLDLGEERWNRNFRALRAYYAQHGDIDVPQDYVTSDGLRLGRFLKNMRFYRDTKYRRCLTPERLRLLDEMGMIWDVSEHRWREGCRYAQAYYEAHGNLQPTNRYVTPDGFKLGAWVKYQREKRARGELSEERVRTLDAMGIRWQTDETKGIKNP